MEKYARVQVEILLTADEKALLEKAVLIAGVLEVIPNIFPIDCIPCWSIAFLTVGSV